jgi:hypothetical protein
MQDFDWRHAGEFDMVVVVAGGMQVKATWWW